ncbi:uncharacterized protein PV09_01423 [Verruconis gallopava]|uniref:Rhodopsin domain-containing protein n=1 Tax=Verruconis gallopava TaxID=253628 RepID=A0A0D2BB94_9PEZI|nr:uncharacterized protein PV09_01423 [Verruconis gallopava]KIW08534.1 hypothetical protein PV09_01423 [Verruconis gallopava]
MASTGPPPPEVLAALAAEPLPWPNQQRNMLTVCIILTTFLWISTIGRIWTRFIVVKKPWWDDFFAVIAVSLFTMSTVSICVMTRYGLGRHAALLSHSSLEKVFLFQWIWGIGYAASTATIKISLLCQYIRVYQPGMITYRFAQLLLIVVCLWGFALTFISTFVCFPSPSAFWKMEPRGCYGFAATKLSELTGTIKGHSASNFFLDCLVLILAIRLQFLKDADTNRKSMLAILIMGTTACGFALWRLIDIIITGGGVGIDPTWNMPGPGLLSTVEVFLAALCATIPFFWPVLREGFNKIFVHYDFTVAEEQIQDDEGYELAKTGSLPAGIQHDQSWQRDGWDPEEKKPITTAVPILKNIFKGSKATQTPPSHIYTGGTSSEITSKKSRTR